MIRNIAGAATAFVLAVGFACPAFADDAAAGMQAMMENHKAFATKMAAFTADISAMTDAHSKMMKADKTQKASAAAAAAMSKDFKTISENFKKIGAEMDKMKDMKPMDMSKPDPKMSELMAKMSAEEKDLITNMQAELDLEAKMMPAPAAAPAAAPAPAPTK